AAAEGIIITELDQGSWNGTEIIRFGPGIAEGCNGLDEQTAWQFETVTRVEGEAIGAHPCFFADTKCRRIVCGGQDVSLDKSVSEKALVHVGGVDTNKAAGIVDGGWRSPEIE